MEFTAFYKMIERTIGEKEAARFEFGWLKAGLDGDRFEIMSEGETVSIRGTSGSALASGFHWYLKHLCGLHLSWCGSNLRMPSSLPVIDKPIIQVTAHEYRYYLNYCTFSYSGAFWDWVRWEREIDWMALNGVNLALNIVGIETVWRNILLHLGYDLHEVSEYLCGPAFFAWQWMGNMDGWGGPLPDWWYDERLAMAQRINIRMRELGIEPVLPGFSGMVPRSFVNKFPDSRPVDQGLWCSFPRPALLLPGDSNYDRLSDMYYEEIQRLFGNDIRYFSMDPFHEGGKTEGVDLAAYARAVQGAMLKHQPQAKWVFQAWEGNPKPELLRQVNPQHALVLDLWCESKPAWLQTEAFYGIPWVWCVIQNYGGKNGLYGDLKGIMQGPLEAAADPRSGRMSGIGLAMEGIGTNPVVYELMADMNWRSEPPDLMDWLVSYCQRRYGLATEFVIIAWKLLQDSVYAKLPIQQGAVESVICARPALDIANVSTWGPNDIAYDSGKLRVAVCFMLRSFDDCAGQDGYLYDLVDFTRQALADLAREQHRLMADCAQRGDAYSFDLQSARFLDMIRMQENLLRTRKEFMLGPWLESAKALGKSYEEKKRFEWNARTLITLWGPEKPATVLRDYSHREWSGLIEDFYLPRWNRFIEAWSQALREGREPEPIDWYSWEYAWTQNTRTYPIEPTGSIKEVVLEIIDTYFT